MILGVLRDYLPRQRGVVDVVVGAGMLIADLLGEVADLCALRFGGGGGSRCCGSGRLWGPQPIPRGSPPPGGAFGGGGSRRPPTFPPRSWKSCCKRSGFVAYSF